MEPQDFKKNLDTGIPHKEIPKGPKGEIRLMAALLISFVLLLVIAGAVFYFYKYQPATSTLKSDSVSTSTSKALEWTSGTDSYIPQSIYEKLPIEKGTEVSHSFIFIKDSEVWAMDKYESSKNIDEIFNAYKKYAESNHRIFSENKTNEKQTITFGRSAFTINVEIVPNSETKKNQITIIFNQKIITSVPVKN